MDVSNQRDTLTGSQQMSIMKVEEEVHTEQSPRIIPF